jgi:hypothetical protein
VDSFGLVELENLPRQLRSDTLSHVFGVHPECGDPGAFLYSETEGHDVADHEAGYRPVEFGHKTGVSGSQGMILDQVLKIGPSRLLGDGTVDAADFIGISGPQPPDDHIFHGRISSPRLMG